MLIQTNSDLQQSTTHSFISQRATHNSFWPNPIFWSRQQNSYFWLFQDTTQSKCRVISDITFTSNGVQFYNNLIESFLEKLELLYVHCNRYCLRKGSAMKRGIHVVPDKRCLHCGQLHPMSCLQETSFWIILKHFFFHKYCNLTDSFKQFSVAVWFCLLSDLSRTFSTSPNTKRSQTLAFSC